MSDCESIRESLAAGEPPTAGAAEHLQRCAACRAFARDVVRLREAAAALPRPTVIPRRAPRPAAPRHRWLLPAIAAALLLAAAIVPSQWRSPPRHAQEAARDPDLLSLMAEARQAWTAAARGEDDWSVTIDPLASLRPAAYLAEAAQREAARDPRRRP